MSETTKRFVIDQGGVGSEAYEDQYVHDLQAEVERLSTELRWHVERQPKYDELRAEVERWKASRIYYQDIVYSVANSLDRWKKGTVCCGTETEPHREVQDGVEAMRAEVERRNKECHLYTKAMGNYQALCETQRAELGRLKGELGK